MDTVREEQEYRQEFDDKVQYIVSSLEHEIEFNFLGNKQSMSKEYTSSKHRDLFLMLSKDDDKYESKTFGNIMKTVEHMFIKRNYTCRLIMSRHGNTYDGIIIINRKSELKISLE